MLSTYNKLLTSQRMLLYAVDTSFSTTQDLCSAPKTLVPFLCLFPDKPELATFLCSYLMNPYITTHLCKLSWHRGKNHYFNAVSGNPWDVMCPHSLTKLAWNSPDNIWFLECVTRTDLLVANIVVKLIKWFHTTSASSLRMCLEAMKERQRCKVSNYYLFAIAEAYFAKEKNGIPVWAFWWDCYSPDELWKPGLWLLHRKSVWQVRSAPWADEGYCSPYSWTFGGSHG